MVGGAPHPPFADFKFGPFFWNFSCLLTGCHNNNHLVGPMFATNYILSINCREYVLLSQLLELKITKKNYNFCNIYWQKKPIILIRKFEIFLWVFNCFELFSLEEVQNIQGHFQSNETHKLAIFFFFSKYLLLFYIYILRIFCWLKQHSRLLNYKIFENVTSITSSTQVYVWSFQ